MYFMLDAYLDSFMYSILDASQVCFQALSLLSRQQFVVACVFVLHFDYTELCFKEAVYVVHKVEYKVCIFFLGMNDDWI